MQQDKAPGPLEGDFYAWGLSDSVRGGRLEQARAIDSFSAPRERITKFPQTFADVCTAPAEPTDVLYVQPRTHFYVRSVSSVSQVANSILFILQSLCPAGTELKTDSQRMKISVLIPGTLDFKVKLFATSNSEEFLVAVRRDSGDWFVFIQLYASIKKQLRLNGGMQVGF